MNLKISSGEIRKMLLSKLSHNFGVSPAEATNEHFYKSLVLVVNDIMNQRRTQFEKNAIKQESKRIYYLCMEFLVGRSKQIFII